MGGSSTDPGLDLADRFFLISFRQNSAGAQAHLQTALWGQSKILVVSYSGDFVSSLDVHLRLCVGAAYAPRHTTRQAAVSDWHYPRCKAGHTSHLRDSDAVQRGCGPAGKSEPGKRQAYPKQAVLEAVRQCRASKRRRWRWMIGF